MKRLEDWKVRVEQHHGKNRVQEGESGVEARKEWRTGKREWIKRKEIYRE